MSALEEWINAEAQFATGAMLRAVSATHLVMERPGFGQRVIPRAGSVVASPVPAHYDPDPDYFFHWFRDAAIVLDALRVALAEGLVGELAVARLREFVQFNRTLRALDGREFLRRESGRTQIQPAFLQYLRPDAEIAALSGDTVGGDVRVNADGTPDLSRWARPQADGPALRCLALLRWWEQLPQLRSDAALRAAIGELIHDDLAFTLAYAPRPCFDIWEEENGHHYYTQLVQAEALTRGATWLEQSGRAERAQACRCAAQQTLSQLDALWDETAGFYRSRSADPPGSAGKELNVAVILAVLHTGRTAGRHSVLDPRAQATLAALEELFEAEYPINHDRPLERGVAMGRYANDRYYSGGAYFFATLGAAEFYFRLAQALHCGARLAATEENRRFRQRLGALPDAAGRRPAALAMQYGDAIMRTVQVFTPAGGALSEQFDRITGVETSAKHLAWSYAAFISAAASRAGARRSTRESDRSRRGEGTA